MRPHKFLTLLILLIASIAVAPVLSLDDPLVNFQGILEQDNSTAPSGNYNFTFNIYTSQTGGSPVWWESHNNIYVENGIYSVNLGWSYSLSGLDFSLNTYWLEIIVNGETLTPRHRITHTMAAMWSEEAKYADSARVWWTTIKNSAWRRLKFPQKSK